MKKLKRILLFFALCVAGFLLFKIGSYIAFAERGYRAVGGEWLLLLLPLMFYIIRRTVQDIVRIIKTTDFTEDFK